MDIVNTKSLCNTCYREISAIVTIKESGVYLEKFCPEHGDSKCQIESDPDYYRTFVQSTPLPENPYYALIIPVTYRCNQNCLFCFSNYTHKGDMPIGEIERFTRQFKGSAVFLSGGEPTVRSDLADIIKSVSRQVPVCGIVTNGLRLSDRTYLETLIDAGLQYVFFSLDSFRADHYEKLDEASIDGHRIIDRKLKALENLENLGVQTVLSSTIYPGVNDDEIAPLFSYSIKKSSFIIEMRFRACCRVGRWKPMEEIFNSQLIERFSHATGIEKDFIYQVDPSYDENTIHHVTIGLQGRMKGGRFVHLKAGRLWRGTKVQKIRSLFRSIIDGQLYSLLEYLVHRRNMVHMRVRFIHWPDVRSVDLSQVDRGVAQVLRDGRILNFCHAIILENRA